MGIWFNTITLSHFKKILDLYKETLITRPSKLSADDLNTIVNTLKEKNNVFSEYDIRKIAAIQVKKPDDTFDDLITMACITGKPKRNVIVLCNTEEILGNETGYELIEYDIKDMFDMLKTRYDGNKAEQSKVGNLVDIDVLLRDFHIDDDNNLVDLREDKVIAHNISMIQRFYTDKHIIFDIACSEHMTLLILKKSDAKVDKILQIGRLEKDKLNKFKAFIESDGDSFTEYLKTQRLLYTV